MLECKWTYAIAALLTRKAIELNPDNADAYNNRGMLMPGKGHESIDSKPLMTMNKAIELNPKLANRP